MKKTATLLFAATAFVACKNEATPELDMSVTYPETKKVDTVDVYFGEKVPDPYRWLENDTTQETSDWVKSQNRIPNQRPSFPSHRSMI